MNLLTTASFSVFLASLPAPSAHAPSGVGGMFPTSLPGFTEAVFDTATIDRLLADDKTVGIRFYNVLASPADTVGTAMAIGIRMDGSEVNSGSSYQLSLGFVSGKITMRMLKKAQAAAACSSMQNSGHPSYSASFTRTEVENLLRPAGCQALQAIPDATAKGEASMRLIPVRIINGKAEPLGPGFLCGFPCPPLCGPEKNYVYRPK